MSRTRLLLLLFALAVPVGPTAAQGLIIAQPLPGPRPLPVPAPAPQPLTIRAQRVALSIDTGAVQAQVTEVFNNPTSTPLEGTYLFNLPEGAAVSNFRMQVDKEPVDGRVVAVEEARRIYEQFVRQRIDPGILEYVGRNVFRARVFPIPPSSDKEIQLGYTHPAAFQNGLYQVVYPLNTDRISPQPLRELVIDCTLKSKQPIKAIYSPTHEIQVSRENDHLARIRFEAKEIRANRDFVLYYSVSEKEFGLNALAHRKAGDDGYLMMMLAPRRDANPVEVLPKDIVFVFDTSGSMQGAKIEQAKRALNTVLGALSPRDRFNIIRFSTEVVNFREGLTEASADNLKSARDFVGEIKAIGGTAIDDALQAAMASLPVEKPGEKRERFVVFMTDGIPTIGQTNVDQILTNADKARKRETRLFVFGVGNDVNALLLDRLALKGGGAVDYVSPDEDLETRIGGFYAKIANPVLSNLKLEVNGAQLAELYPRQLPDLFAGGQLLVLGRYKGEGKATVKVTGEIGGSPRAYTYEVALPTQEKGSAFIPRLWASRKIGYLLEEIRLHGENDELKNEVVRLSKESGIITPYTAYLVEEPGLAPPGSSPMSALGGRFGGSLARRGAMDGAARGAGGAAGAAAPGQVRARPEGGLATEDLALLPAGAERERREKLRNAADAYGFRQSTGREAVDQSRRLQELKQQVVATEEAETLKEVEGRRFEWKEGTWNDVTAAGKLTVVPVKFASDAYFQLLSQQPEWAKFLSLGKAVVFRSGKTHAVKIGEAGKEKLTAAELKALVE